MLVAKWSDRKVQSTGLGFNLDIRIDGIGQPRDSILFFFFGWVSVIRFIVMTQIGINGGRGLRIG